jgi:ribosomal protein S18 acetylase RimI-like enzyme
MEFNIRRAAVEDAQAIASVKVDTWRSTYVGIVPDAFLKSLNAREGAEDWRAHLQAQDMLAFVAEDRSDVFGFICGGKLRDVIDGYDGELYAIYIRPEGQRSGVGRLLVRSLVEALQIKGLKSMVVWVLERNLGAVSFYQRLGAIQIARKTIEIGGAELWDLALGWPNLESFLN